METRHHMPGIASRGYDDANGSMYTSGAADVDEHKNTLLHIIALTGNVPNCETLLERAETLPDAVNADGATPLAWAAMQGHAGVATTLVRAGAEPNVVDRSGCTPLLIAAQNSQHLMMLWLLEHGAGPLAADLNGCTAAHWCAHRGDVRGLALLAAAGHAGLFSSPDAEGCLPIHRAAKAGKASSVLWLLDQARIDPRIRLWGALGPTFRLEHARAATRNNEERSKRNACCAGLAGIQSRINAFLRPSGALSSCRPHPSSLTAVAEAALMSTKVTLASPPPGTDVRQMRQAVAAQEVLVRHLRAESAKRDAAESSVTGALARLWADGFMGPLSMARLVGPACYTLFLAQALAAFMMEISSTGATLITDVIYCTLLGLLLLQHAGLYLSMPRYCRWPTGERQSLQPWAVVSAGLTPMQKLYAVRRVRAVEVEPRTDERGPGASAPSLPRDHSPTSDGDVDDVVAEALVGDGHNDEEEEESVDSVDSDGSRSGGSDREDHADEEEEEGAGLLGGGAGGRSSYRRPRPRHARRAMMQPAAMRMGRVTIRPSIHSHAIPTIEEPAAATDVNTSLSSPVPSDVAYGDVASPDTSPRDGRHSGAVVQQGAGVGVVRGRSVSAAQPGFVTPVRAPIPGTPAGLPHATGGAFERPILPTPAPPQALGLKAGTSSMLGHTEPGSAASLLAEVEHLASGLRRVYPGQDLAAGMAAAAATRAGVAPRSLTMSAAPPGSCAALAHARVCWTCGRLQSFRTHHDATTGRCYDGYQLMDPWAGAVIHKFNVGQYVAWLGTTLLACLIFLGYTVRHVVAVAAEGAAIASLAHSAAPATTGGEAGSGSASPDTPATGLPDLSSLPTTPWAVLLTRPALAWFSFSLLFMVAFTGRALWRQVQASSRGLTQAEVQCMRDKSCPGPAGFPIASPWPQHHGAVLFHPAFRTGLQDGGLGHLYGFQWRSTPGPGVVASGTLVPVLSNPWQEGDAAVASEGPQAESVPGQHGIQPSPRGLCGRGRGTPSDMHLGARSWANLKRELGMGLDDSSDVKSACAAACLPTGSLFGSAWRTVLSLAGYKKRRHGSRSRSGGRDGRGGYAGLALSRRDSSSTLATHASSITTAGSFTGPGAGAGNSSADAPLEAAGVELGHASSKPGGAHGDHDVVLQVDDDGETTRLRSGGAGHGPGAATGSGRDRPSRRHDAAAVAVQQQQRWLKLIAARDEKQVEDAVRALQDLLVGQARAMAGPGPLPHVPGLDALRKRIRAMRSAMVASNAFDRQFRAGSTVQV